LQNGWEAFRGDSSDARDLLFTARRSAAFLVRTQVGVFLAPNTARQAACDLKMKCSAATTTGLATFILATPTPKLLR